ncbi:hypothetical protein H072_7149 [Dactylellina haptotyla CBS 200.50]|uniref:HD domain-containing protein n=1 Tax=Dactylellina haptotyla (strain CBS 200.50) TaxID=1284197 RepID=S8BIC7_DACHA|nr:hypothetical protein H072_7149 [Dactylellina haptotyla CBS 200.50]
MSLLPQHAFRTRYSEFLNSCGVPGSLEYSEAMEQAYTDPSRAYHNNTHITFMLDKLAGDISSGQIILTDWEQKCVTFAIYWHDFVYDSQTQANDNERQSIIEWKYFVDQVSRISPILQTYLQPVSILIDCTIKHAVPDIMESPLLSTNVISYFLDLDLAILASERDVYSTYANNIRKEYRSYPLQDYRNKRAEVLKGFLDREKIFLMSRIEGKEDSMRGMEEKARENVGWEVGELEAGRMPEE